MSEGDEKAVYEVPLVLMRRILNVVDYYANIHTYRGERVGGVLQGCPHAPDPTPDELTVEARLLMALLEQFVRPAALPVEAQPVASEFAQRVLAADPNFFKPMQFPEWDNNVAWLRYDDHNGRSATSIDVCDPDAEGAFKVYRHPAPASPAKGDGADRAVASTAGTDAADMIVELRTKLQNLIAELPDTRRLLIARTDAEATLKISSAAYLWPAVNPPPASSAKGDGAGKVAVADAVEIARRICDFGGEPLYRYRDEYERACSDLIALEISLAERAMRGAESDTQKDADVEGRRGHSGD